MGRLDLTDARVRSPKDGRELPLIVEPGADGCLVRWGCANSDAIRSLLLDHGGLLFRGFDVGGVDGFERFVHEISGELIEYRDRATPRTHVSGRIHTATDYPPSQSIFLHNESSFARTWPSHIHFHCLSAADRGGRTTLVDVRKVFSHIAPAIRGPFIEKGVLYARNLGGAFGLGWQEVFQTDRRADMEEYCRDAGIEFEWRDEDRVRIRQVRPAAALHPQTAEPLWFNHAAVLHVSTLDPGLRSVLLRLGAEEDLPNNTYYGDGTPIEPGVMDALRRAYLEQSVTPVDWQAGDVLTLDNMLVAHGREPFSGRRELVAGLAGALGWQDVAPVTVASHNARGNLLMEFRERLRARIEEILAEGDREVPGGLEDDTSLIASGLLESLTLLELAGWIEEEIGSMLPLEGLDLRRAWDTIDAICSFVEPHDRKK